MEEQIMLQLISKRLHKEALLRLAVVLVILKNLRYTSENVVVFMPDILYFCTFICRYWTLIAGFIGKVIHCLLWNSCDLVTIFLSRVQNMWAQIFNLKKNIIYIVAGVSPKTSEVWLPCRQVSAIWISTHTIYIFKHRTKTYFQIVLKMHWLNDLTSPKSHSAGPLTWIMDSLKAFRDKPYIPEWCLQVETQVIGRILMQAYGLCSRGNGIFL